MEPTVDVCSEMATVGVSDLDVTAYVHAVLRMYMLDVLCMYLLWYRIKSKGSFDVYSRSSGAWRDRLGCCIVPSPSAYRCTVLRTLTLSIHVARQP